MSSETRQGSVGRRPGTLTSLVLIGAALAATWGCATSRAFEHGNTAARSGDWDLAVTYFTKAAQGAPGRPDYRIALERASLAASRDHLGKAHAFEQQDQLDFALREYRKVVEYDGANQEARAKIQQLEQTIRDRIEASRPRPAIERLREKARQVGPEPTLNPTSRDPLFIKFTNQQVRDILNFIGAATGINVTYDSAFVDKPYSVELSGVTLEQALQQILAANLLFFKVINERSIIVIPDTNVKRLAYEEQAIQTFFLSHADPQEMLTLLNSVLRPQQPVQAVFAANKTNNTITARGTVAMLQIIERVIQANDRPRAEIVVDVEILEVNRTRAKQYGLDLSEFALGMVFSPESRPSSGTAGSDASASLFNVNTLSVGVSAADFYAAVPSAVIRFLESDSETKVVAKPQLRGSEGEKLTLNLGTEFPVPSTTFTPIVGGGTAYNPMTSFQYKTVGVNVEIEPRVTYEGDIIMKLSVEVSAQAGDKNVAGQNLPAFGTRKATTRLRLRDGESNLLAGLLQETERKSLKGFPGLSHVPLLKQLFSSNDNSIEQTDIVMLLTPHIVRTHELTQRDVGRIYIGTQQSLGLTGPPPLIAPPATETEPPAAAPPAGGITPAGTAAPARPMSGPPVAGSPVPAPPGSTTIPIVPPGSSPIPGTVGVQPTPPGMAAAPPPLGPPAAAPAPMFETPAKPPQPPEGPAAQVSVALPGPDMMVAGGPYTVPIAISGANRMSAASISLTYNPRALRVRLVQEGTFMRQGGVTVVFAQQVDAEGGRVDITISRTGDTVGATGAGMLAAVVFDAVAQGPCPLSLSGVATGPGGAALPLQFQSATVTVR